MGKKASIKYDKEKDVWVVFNSWYGAMETFASMSDAIAWCAREKFKIEDIKGRQG